MMMMMMIMMMMIMMMMIMMMMALDILIKAAGGSSLTYENLDKTFGAGREVATNLNQRETLK